jgi:hypothetical protein
MRFDALVDRYERVGGEDVKYVEKGESSWLCVKLEFGFITGHGSLIRVVPSSYLALTVIF